MRRQGKRVRTEHLEVRVLASLSALPSRRPTGLPDVDEAPAGGRVGIIVPRHRHSAVDRNRVKRRLRELVRLRLLPALPDGAVVLRARPEAYAASFEALARDVDRAARDVARLLRPAPGPAPGPPPAVPRAVPPAAGEPR